MPRGHKPGSRTSSAAAAQSTISFGSKSRVTKPSAAPTHASAKKIKHDIVEPIVSDVSTEEIQTPEPDVEKKPTTAEIAIREQTKREFQAPTRDEVEEQALKLSNAQLKKYWKAREDERKVPRVHQEDLSMNEKILRHFDLSSQYGPCIGIARLKRWKRAKNLSLNPPIEVLAVLLREEEKENVTVQRAHVDELMSGRFIADH